MSVYADDYSKGVLTADQKIAQLMEQRAKLRAEVERLRVVQKILRTNVDRQRDEIGALKARAERAEEYQGRADREIEAAFKVDMEKSLAAKGAQ